MIYKIILILWTIVIIGSGYIIYTDSKNEAYNREIKGSCYYSPGNTFAFNKTNLANYYNFKYEDYKDGYNPKP